MPIACVLIPHFALRVALLDRPELDGAPLVLGPPPGTRPLVHDATPEAAARGIRPGLGLREVVALCPEAITLPPHPAREAAALDRVVAGLETLSPLVEPDPSPAGAAACYVDLRGLERRLGPPPVAAECLLATVPPPLRPRVGVAPTRFAARVAADRAAPGGVRVVAAVEVAAFLAGASTALLPRSLVPPETLRRLERLGLQTLGDLAALPATAVQARFGRAGRAAWELARGNDPTPVHPQPRPETVVATLPLPDPATSRETLLVALTRLALDLFDRPALHGRHVRQARLRTLIEGDRVWEQTATLREPGGRQKVIEVLGYRLQGASALPGPVEAVTLELSGLIDASGRQDYLPGLRPRQPRQLAEASRRLKQQYGEPVLYRVVEVEPWSRIPERRRALIAYDP